MGGLLDFVDTQPIADLGLEDESSRVISDEVISRVNAEFDESALRAPSDEDRRIARQRIGSLVAAAVRRRGNGLSARDEGLLADDIARRVLGLGFLDLLLPPARTDLTEIAITPDGKLMVKVKGKPRFELLEEIHPDRYEVGRVLAALLGPQGSSLNEATPSVDAKLPKTRHNPGGGRVKAIHPCIAPGAGFPSVNIRLFEQQPVKPEQLLSWGALNQEMLDVLAEAVAQTLRIFIAGGTGTGKTTILSALTNYIDETERIVKIEDPEEIFVDHLHVVTLEARHRPPGSEVPSYSIKDAVDDAMRMTPDWLVVGEVRTGKAAMSLFRAQMSDHPGLSTFHAESPGAAVHRLAVIMDSDAGVKGDASKALFAMAVDLVMQLGYDRFGQRRVTEIAEVGRGLKGGMVQFKRLFVFDQDNSTEDRPLWTQTGEITRRRR